MSYLKCFGNWLLKLLSTNILSKEDYIGIKTDEVYISSTFSVKTGRTQTEHCFQMIFVVVCVHACSEMSLDLFLQYKSFDECSQ
jgi:hypothetical protein